jgi:hypothetical protein
MKLFQGLEVENGIIEEVMNHIGEACIGLFFLKKSLVTVKAVRIEESQSGKMALLSELFRCRRQEEKPWNRMS